MIKTTDRPDESLKQASKNWWTTHSQDYVDPGEIDHLGVDINLADEDLVRLLEKFDRNFAMDGYFAQKKGDMLFSGLLPKNLSNKRVLEVGCGLGAHTEALCRLGAQVSSIDIASTSVSVTRRRMALKGLEADIQEADAERLPFSDACFDYVWSWGVIHHSPDTKQCAREIERVLKPGGRVGIMLYHRNSLYNWLNVVCRYGVLRGKLLHMSIQDLHNRYTDGKNLMGAPLSKYYSARDVREVLFPALEIERQISFEQKRAISFIVPPHYRRRFEEMIPDGLYTRLWSKLGFLIFTEGRKPLVRDPML
jgi:ubiquinone/menaquinone biosynthesis C-methylase UbiE